MSWWSESEPHWGNDAGASEPRDTQALWLAPGQTRSGLLLAVAGPWVMVDSSAGKAGLRSTTALLSSPDFQVQAQQASAVLSRSTPPDPHCARSFGGDLQAPTPGLKAGPLRAEVLCPSALWPNCIVVSSSRPNSCWFLFTF